MAEFNRLVSWPSSNSQVLCGLARQPTPIASPRDQKARAQIGPGAAKTAVFRAISIVQRREVSYTNRTAADQPAFQIERAS